MKDEHSKTRDWPGWAEARKRDGIRRQFGLEMQHPYADHVLSGRKTIETRAYDLPPDLVSDDGSNDDVVDGNCFEVKIDILESEKGRAGVSSVPDRASVALDLDGAVEEAPRLRPMLKRKGWCTFTQSFRYATREQFEADEDKHLVDSNSGYGWSEERPMFGWVVGSYGVYAIDDAAGLMSRSGDDAAHYEFVAERRMRSLFEIKCIRGGNQEESVG